LSFDEMTIAVSLQRYVQLEQSAGSARGLDFGKLLTSSPRMKLELSEASGEEETDANSSVEQATVAAAPEHLFLKAAQVSNPLSGTKRAANR
jgi:hypothetical protein